MKINFKNKMYIYHPDGKFTEAQLCELLEAARKMGYDEGYEAAKAYYNKPDWWYCTNTTPTVHIPYITCTSDSTNSDLTSTTTTATTISNKEFNKVAKITIPKTMEFRYDGTER